MSKIIDLVLGLIAYVCVATVITLALILGYLWHSDQLSNEKVFRIVALMQDVDMQQMAAAEKKSTDEVPPEEPSLNEVRHHQQVQDRNYEVRLLALQRGKRDYDDSKQKLEVTIERFDSLAEDLQSKLNQERELTTKQNVATVVKQLEQVQPEVGKDALMRWIDDRKMDDAILLMSKMSEGKLAKILKTFETKDELGKLHEIHERIISGGGDNPQLEKAIDELDAVNARN